MIESRDFENTMTFVDQSGSNYSEHLYLDSLDPKV